MNEPSSHPETPPERPVSVKKGVLYGAIAAAGVIVALILTGLNYLNHRAQIKTRPAANASLTRLAGADDMGWYHDRKQAAPVTPAASTPKALNHAKPSTTASVLPPASAALPLDKPEAKAFEDLQKAQQAPISAQQIISQGAEAALRSPEQAENDKDLKEGASLSAGTSEMTADPNGQAAKQAFLKASEASPVNDYLTASLQTPISPYELQAGSLIPGILLTGINSDLPGMITGQVRQNVYDSVSGGTVLIPQGAKVIGLYDAQIAYGQERVLIAWQRIIFPNGESLNLKGMPGVDMSGYAGFHDQVNNHYAKVFGSVVLMSLLSAGAQLSQPQNQTANILTVNAPTVGQTLAQSLGTNIAGTGTQLTQKNLNVQPTLQIRPGYAFNISVAKDIVFPHAYTG